MINKDKKLIELFKEMEVFQNDFSYVLDIELDDCDNSKTLFVLSPHLFKFSIFYLKDNALLESYIKIKLNLNGDISNATFKEFKSSKFEFIVNSYFGKTTFKDSINYEYFMKNITDDTIEYLSKIPSHRLHFLTNNDQKSYFDFLKSLAGDDISLFLKKYD